MPGARVVCGNRRDLKPSGRSAIHGSRAGELSGGEAGAQRRDGPNADRAYAVVHQQCQSATHA